MILSLVSLKYFCIKKEKIEKIHDLENINWEILK